jgi:hypothetical protein
MPAVYILVHLILAAACLWLALRLPLRSPWRATFGLGVLSLTVLGFAVERLPAWSWHAMRFAFPDLVFLTNISFAAASTLLGLMWSNALREANRKAALARATLLSLPLLGVALYSYTWYFSPLPPDLSGKPDIHGFCRQTSDDSCSACAATMLLAPHGIKADEAEMGRLCLTRFKQGTPPLGLYRSLAIKAHEIGLHPQFVFLNHPREFHALHRAAIIAVGIKASAPREIKLKMENYGWNPGQRHAVVILDADKDGKWLDVADPTYGRERWPTKDLEYLWDGSAVVLTK